KRIALAAAIVSAAFALLPYGLDEMGMDVRLLLVANLPAVAVGWALARYTPLGTPKWVGILAVVFFLLTLVLLRGIEGIPGMQPVSVLHWGGITLNILLAVAGITLSLPIGIALALGRRSALPVVKLLCVVFIEVFRGVPLITLLFMSQVLVPLAFPEDLKPNSLIRAAIIITLFSAAYMAENIRGGLQAINPGQIEAARALGLPGWQTTLFISLPQAIRNVIPAIVGQFIALFKDTSLVYIIGMLDIVEISRAFIQGNTEYLSSAKELFIFLALVFWVFTYSMSYVSGRVERHLGVGQR
ncbi:MAG: amino acid ABC transporter permease, partial [Dehalococcoidia bacterium]|nr:amino acid ABC transporter permease [Dehalococcoidia bacterium]